MTEEPKTKEQKTTREKRSGPLPKSAQPPLPAPYASWPWAVTAGGAALFLGVLLLAFFWFLRRPLAILFLGITFAAALAPVVTWLERWLPRGAAILVAYLTLTLMFVGLGVMILPTVVNQAERLIEQAPAWADQAQQWIAERLALRDGLPIEQILSQITNLASALVSLPVQLSSSLLDIFLVIFMSLYALHLAPQAHNLLISLFPKARRAKITAMLDKMSHGMGGYFRGVIITGAIVGVASYIGMLIIGIEFALFLAIVAAMMEFIPMIGPLISGILIATFAFLQSPTKALITIPFVLALQQIENHIIAPNVMHPQTNISRLATVFVIFAGWSVGGVLGALVAIPLYAAFRVFTSEIILPMARRQWGTHDEHKPPTS